MNILTSNEYKMLDFPKIILLFYLIVASNYTKHLYSGQLETFLKDNKLAQHFIGILTIFVLMTLSESVMKNIPQMFIYSLIIYFWFIFSTKLDIQWNIIIILLLITSYVYNLYLIKDESLIDSDYNLNSQIREEIYNKHNNNKKWTLGLILGTTGIGTLLYMLKKNQQYGGNFDINKFILD